jgi:histone H3/H4
MQETKCVAKTMTIEAKGHVHAIEAVGGGITEVAVTLCLEASRLAEHPHRITIRAKPTEIDSYKVGMAVIVQVRPA